MVLTHIKVFLSRNDVKILLFCTLTGGILQFLAKKYIKNHPELLNDLEDSTPKELIDSKPKELIPRGGAFPIASLTLIPVVLKFLAEHGLIAGIMSGLGILTGKIPITALSTILRKCSPQNMAHLDKHQFLLLDGQMTYIDQCDGSMQYLLKIFHDENIPLADKKELVEKIFSKYLNLNTMNGKRNFVLCLAFISYIISTSNLYLLMGGLIKAIKEGKISKEMGRLIVRKLLKSGIIVDPELVEIVKY